MVSTAGDYARFARMLLEGGTLDGVRILSRKSVELMTSDALPPGAAMPWPGDGFGLGVAVRTSRGIPPAPGSVGAFGWAGIHGTSFTVDPAERLVVVWMVQRASFPAAMATWARYRAMIYAAVE
jgi:CubicO group peptidase (beta-lactamase class C family)